MIMHRVIAVSYKVKRNIYYEQIVYSIALIVHIDDCLIFLLRTIGRNTK